MEAIVRCFIRSLFFLRNDIAIHSIVSPNICYRTLARIFSGFLPEIFGNLQ